MHGIIIYSGAGSCGLLTKRQVAAVPSRGAAGLSRLLLSLGAEKESVDRLSKSKALDRVVIPVYWTDGIVSKARPLWLTKLPAFLKSFEKEFPDGQVRWDPHYEGTDPSWGDLALHVYFNYQEDDDGDHWSPAPSLLEEEAYHSYVSTRLVPGEESGACGEGRPRPLTQYFLCTRKSERSRSFFRASPSSRFSMRWRALLT